MIFIVNYTYVCFQKGEWSICINSSVYSEVYKHITKLDISFRLPYFKNHFSQYFLCKMWSNKGSIIVFYNWYEKSGY